MRGRGTQKLNLLFFVLSLFRAFVMEFGLWATPTLGARLLRLRPCSEKTSLRAQAARGRAARRAREMPCVSHSRGSVRSGVVLRANSLAPEIRIDSRAKPCRMPK